MEIGIRIFALLLDIAFGFGTYFLMLTGLGWILDKLGNAGFVLSPLALVVLLVWPILYLSIPTGLWGKPSANGSAVSRSQITWTNRRASGVPWEEKCSSCWQLRRSLGY